MGRRLLITSLISWLISGVAAALTVLPVSGALAAERPVNVYETTRDALLAIQRADGSPAALRELGRRSLDDRRVAAVCHAIAHDLGHAALTAAGGEVATVLNDRDDVCGGGFTHGAIEQALGASTRPERDLLRICAPAQDGSCWHGVGHGLMFATGMDVTRSTTLCDRAPRPVLAIRCGEGVFMQRFSGDAAAGHLVTAPVGYRTPSLATAARECAAVRSPYGASCWFYAPTLWLAEHPEDFAGALRWCEAQVSAGRSMCTKGLGSRTIKFHPEDPRIGAAVCRSARDVDACLRGMASYWSVHWAGKRPGRDVCGRLGDATLERRCRAVA